MSNANILNNRNLTDRISKLDLSNNLVINVLIKHLNKFEKCQLDEEKSIEPYFRFTLKEMQKIENIKNHKNDFKYAIVVAIEYLCSVHYKYMNNNLIHLVLDILLHFKDILEEKIPDYYCKDIKDTIFKIVKLNLSGYLNILNENSDILSHGYKKKTEAEIINSYMDIKNKLNILFDNNNDFLTEEKTNNDLLFKNLLNDIKNEYKQDFERDNRWLEMLDKIIHNKVEKADDIKEYLETEDVIISGEVSLDNFYNNLKKQNKNNLNKLLNDYKNSNSIKIINVVDRLLLI